MKSAIIKVCLAPTPGPITSWRIKPTKAGAAKVAQTRFTIPQKIHPTSSKVQLLTRDIGIQNVNNLLDFHFKRFKRLKCFLSDPKWDVCLNNQKTTIYVLATSQTIPTRKYSDGMKTS